MPRFFNWSHVAGRWLGAMCVLGGCDHSGPATSPPVPSDAGSPQTRSAWRGQNGSAVVAVSGDGDADQELAAAIAQARRTAHTARSNWSIATLAERDRWAVKWAAPLAPADDAPIDRDRVEHVWVRPINWSPFRIEGILLSEPVNELASGKARNEIVSFPIQELSDWIHLLEGNAAADIDKPFAGPHEGGFTVDVLQKRFGAPKT